MAFRPDIGDVRAMDPRIFRPKPMQLFAALLDLQLADRLSYDAERNTLFVNFEGMAIRSPEDIESVRRVFEALCSRIGRKVALVVNYDGFRLDEVAERRATSRWSASCRRSTTAPRCATRPAPSCA